MSDNKCLKCERSFNSPDGLMQHNQSKHPEEVKQPRVSMSPQKKRKIRNWTIKIAVLVLIVGGIYFLFSNVKTLPPTDFRGHVEESPPSHILKTPMELTVQKHMLEHSDGDGPPGVIISYNCFDFECEDDLIEKLEAFTEQYNHVYVAPFPKQR